MLIPALNINLTLILGWGLKEFDTVMAATGGGPGDATTSVAFYVYKTTFVWGKAIVKVIFETCLLTDEEKLKACELSAKAGAQFVKTSTGFNAGGATIHDVELMKKAVAGRARGKAAGGIRDQETAKAMIAAGAERIGTSSGVAIVKGAKGAAAY